MKPIFITTPIFYANAKPHIGHAYTLCIADAWARYINIQNQSCLQAFPSSGTQMRPLFFHNNFSPATFLSTGVDEHGLKVEKQANQLKMKPQDLCNQVSGHFKDLIGLLNVNAGTFIRTTDISHRRTVQEIWEVLEKKGFLYWDLYRGWYSTVDETFYAEWEVENKSAPYSSKEIKLAKVTGSPVEWVEEETCRFRLQDFKPYLHQWLDSGVLPKDTQSRLKLVEETHKTLDFLEDPSVSRPSERVPWGIPVPNRKDQTVYVWFDALINYLTVSKSDPNSPISLDNLPMWPPDFQFIGKDITRFHAILWPALLLAADLPLPKMIIPHAHILSDGKKMSKSTGNVLSPSDIVEEFTRELKMDDLDMKRKLTTDFLRYCMIRSVCLDENASFKLDEAKKVVNDELVNSLGNLLSRLSSKSLNPEQSTRVMSLREAEELLLRAELDAEFYSVLVNLRGRFHDSWWNQRHPNRAIDLLSEVTHRTNSFVDRHKPWEDKSKRRTKMSPENVLSISFEALRLVNCFLSPITPSLSNALFTRLGISSEKDIISSNTRPLGNNETSLIPRFIL